MKYVLSTTLLYLSMVNWNLFGQDLPPIQLDRPDQTECPFITPSGYIQIENGVTIENMDTSTLSYSLPTTLWKYGINDRFEFRLVTDVVSERGTDGKSTGLDPITIGFKAALVEEKGILPKISFIGHMTTSRIGSLQFQSKYIAPSFRFTMQHTLSDKLSLAYNFGAEWDGESAAQTYIYTLTSGLSCTERLGCYAEFFGFFPSGGSPDHRFDCGLTYLMSDDWIADVSGGFLLSNPSVTNYVSLGLSFRFNTRG